MKRGVAGRIPTLDHKLLAMGSDTTLPDESSNGERVAAPSALALVVIWSGQPEHCGCILRVPPVPIERSYVFGRGEPRADDPHPRLLPMQICHDAEIYVAAFESRRLSRAQAVVRQLGNALHVQNVGQCRMSHNDDETRVASVQEQDRLQFGNQLLLLCVRRTAWQSRAPKARRAFSFGEPDAGRLVGESASMQSLREQLEFVAAQREHVLVTGASGTGKELVVNAIHNLSARKSAAIVARNAATFPESLIDAELFGNARNYPNSGMPERPGLLGHAHGSTLFLDEVAELPLTLQTHLLRVLDTGEYQRLGDATRRVADVRVIGATNRPERLREDVRARFKLHVHCPSLDERREDIPLLVNSLLSSIAEHSPAARRFFPDGDHARQPRISIELIRSLLVRSYTTNVRELSRFLLESIHHSAGDTLDALPEEVMEEAPQPAKITPSASPAANDPSSLSRDEILQALENDEWVVERAWKTLGLASRHVLTRLMAKHALRRS